MGAGIAKLIRAKYPEVYAADCKTIKGDANKLGTILPVKLENSSHPLYCFLNYNQFRYGRDRRYVNYESFYQCLKHTKEKCIELGMKSIGIPYKMSCANAGGSWSIIFSMIEEVFLDVNLDVFICKYEDYKPF